MTLIQRLQQIVLFPFLLPVFFVLHIARYFFGMVPPVSILQMVGIYLLLSGGLYFLFRLILRRPGEAGLAAFLLVGLMLYWTATIHFIAGLLHVTAAISNIPFLVAVYALIIVLACWLYRKLAEATRRLVIFYLNTLFVLLILLEGGYLGYNTIRLYGEALKIAEGNEPFLDRQAKGGGNIYLLLFDEYASSASLKEDWGFDNSAMDSFLKSRGFFINADSRSNYNLTLFSMASLLQMEYVQGPAAEVTVVRRPDNQRCIAAIEDSRVVQVLGKAGYALRNYSIFDVAGQPKQELTDFIIDKTKLITVNTFFNLLQRDYLPYLRYRQQLKKDPAYREPAFYRTDEYNNEGVRTVLKEAMLKDTSPKFVYVHFMMPHSDFYYDANDQLMSAARIRSISDAEAPRYYGYNVQHANEKLRQMVDTIQRHDPAATIIVLGDHGYRLHNDEGPHPEHFRNMSAIFFPDRNYSSIPDSLTNVNVFRVVLNKVCGTDYPMLGNREFVLREVE